MPSVGKFSNWISDASLAEMQNGLLNNLTISNKNNLNVYLP